MDFLQRSTEKLKRQNPIHHIQTLIDNKKKQAYNIEQARYLHERIPYIGHDQHRVL